MRIVHVSIGALPPVFDTDGGAIQRRVAELALIQARQGHDVEVFSPGREAQTRPRHGITTHYVRVRAPGPLSYLEYQARVVARLLGHPARPDLLHFHSEPEGAIIGRRLRCATVLSYDNYYFRGGRSLPSFPLYRHALSQFDALLPCSHYCAAASASYWKLDRERLSVIYNGVNLDSFRPDPAAAERERQRLDLQGKVLLYLGRVCEQKGSDTLLSAFKLIRKVDPTVQLIIAGPLEQFSATSSRTDWPRLIANSGARYLGQVSDSRLPGLLTLADIFVMPTRRLEMFGMAAVEAQACGTPVVASDHGGLRETVPDDVGRRFPPGDSQQLAACVLELLADDALRAKLGAGARRHAARFAWTRVASDLEEVYGSLRARNQRRLDQSRR